jgi:integrase
MRLPNGFGNINKLSGNRRKPFRARVPQGYTDDGKRIWLNLGYYEKYNEALAALVDYNRDPTTADGDVTFSEVFEKWFSTKCEDIAERSVKLQKSVYNRCAPVANMKMRDIRLDDMQAIVDEVNSQTYKSKIKSLFTGVFSYATAHDIITGDHDKTKHIKTGKPKNKDIHYRFSRNDVDIMWDKSEDDRVKVILMMIYSGARPGELVDILKKNVDLDNACFHITEGKNNNAIRTVPIHHMVLPFYKHFMEKKGEYLFSAKKGGGYSFAKNYGFFIRDLWNPTLKDLGILEYTPKDGIAQKHLPHDTRHTFASMWADKKLNEMYRRKIQGHSGNGIGEQIYTHIEIEELRNELNKL